MQRRKAIPTVAFVVGTLMALVGSPAMANTERPGPGENGHTNCWAENPMLTDLDPYDANTWPGHWKVAGDGSAQRVTDDETGLVNCFPFQTDQPTWTLTSTETNPSTGATRTTVSSSSGTQSTTGTLMIWASEGDVLTVDSSLAVTFPDKPASTAVSWHNGSVVDPLAEVLLRFAAQTPLATSSVSELSNIHFAPVPNPSAEVLSTARSCATPALTNVFGATATVTCTEAITIGDVHSISGQHDAVVRTSLDFEFNWGQYEAPTESLWAWKNSTDYMTIRASNHVYVAGATITTPPPVVPPAVVPPVVIPPIVVPPVVAKAVPNAQTDGIDLIEGGSVSPLSIAGLLALLAAAGGAVVTRKVGVSA